MTNTAPTPVPSAKFPPVLDSTIRASYLACPRKFYYAHMRDLRRDANSIHLHFGGCYASGLEELRKAIYFRGEPADHALTSASRVVLEQWGDYELPPNAGQKTLENCLLALAAYTEKFPPKTDYIQPFFIENSPTVEFSFALPMELSHPDTGDPILYAGRFDWLGKYNDKLWVVDDKTSTRLGASWLKQWVMRGQFLGYCKAALEYGLPVSGALVRGMAPLSSEISFAEKLLAIQPWKIEEWWETLHHDVERMIADYREGVWRKVFDSACAHFGSCSYDLLCDTPHPERFIPVEYVIEHWNPLERKDA